MTKSSVPLSPDARGTRADRFTQVIYWMLLIAGCAVFLLMNIYTTVKEDDLFHSMIGGGSSRPINTLADIFRSWVEYYRYDARTANIISFTFNGILGKSVFNVFNTLVFGVMAHLLSRVTARRNSPMVLAVLFTYIVTAMPVPGETLLWATASFNNLWNWTATSLLVVYLLSHRNSAPAWWLCVLLLLVAAFTGAINEGMTLGAFGGLVLYYLFNRDKVDRVVVVALIGYLMGVLLLLTCPGAWDRASLEVSHDSNPVTMLSQHFHAVLPHWLHYVTPVAALLVLIIDVAIRGFKRVLLSTPWPFIFLALLAFTFVLGKDQPRLYFPVSMAGLLIVTEGLCRLLERWAWLRWAIVALGLAVCIHLYPSNIATMKRYQAFFDRIDTTIRQSPESQVILKKQIFDGYSRFIKYFNFDSWTFFIREETLCHHYNKKNIQFVPDSIYERFHSGRLLDGAVLMPMAAPQCPDIDNVLAVPSQGYMLVKMKQDTISHTYQHAQAYQADGTPMPLPVSYFPLLYQGPEYLIFPLLSDTIHKLVFSPYALDGPTVDLLRCGPNP